MWRAVTVHFASPPQTSKLSATPAAAAPCWNRPVKRGTDGSINSPVWASGSACMREPCTAPNQHASTGQAAAWRSSWAHTRDTCDQTWVACPYGLHGPPAGSHMITSTRYRLRTISSAGIRPPGLGQGGAGLSMGGSVARGGGAGGQGARGRITNTSQVHGSGQEQRDLGDEARTLMAQYLEEGAQVAADAAHVDPAAAAAALNSLFALLPDLRGVLLGAAATDAELGAAADTLTTLTLMGLDRREMEVMSLFSSMMGRDVRVPAERHARNALVRLVWDLFADARMLGRVDRDITGPALCEIQSYRSSWRTRSVEVIATLASCVVRAGLLDVAARIVALRGALRGDVASAVARTPELLAAPAEVVAAAAARVEEAGGLGDDAWVVEEVVRQAGVSVQREWAANS